MNQPYYAELVFSLSELLDHGVAQHSDVINDLSAAASGEAQLKESLTNISKARSRRFFATLCRLGFYFQGREQPQ